MSGKRYADEFKIEAVRRVTVRGHKVADVAQRLGITTHSLYACDVPPILSSTVFWSPITREKEIGREEALHRGADHWLPAGG